MQSSSSVWLDWIKPRFSAFASDSPSQWVIGFEAAGPTPDFLDSPLEVHNEAVELDSTGSGFDMRGATFSARVDLGQRLARLRGPLATYPLDGLLRHLLPFIVEDGLVLHGGMLADGDSSWVVSGPPECGKSTICELLPDNGFCDEMVAVRRLDSTWVAESLPFWQGRPRRARLEGLFLLRHGRRHERTRLAAGEGLRRLAAQTLWPTARQDSVDSSFQRLSDLLDEVPVWDLAFLPRPDVFELIRQRSGE